MARPLNSMGLTPSRRDIMPTLLIVEDDSAILESVTDIAKEGGYLVAPARDADQALSLLGRGGISVVLTDLQMPGSIDGFALVRRVAQLCPAGSGLSRARSRREPSFSGSRSRKKRWPSSSWPRPDGSARTSNVSA
jgi:hypothetical protein